MAYERGTGTVEVELSRLQSWVENADVDLYGRSQDDKGVIREHRDATAAREAVERYLRYMVGLMAIFGGVPSLIFFLELIHVIPK